MRIAIVGAGGVGGCYGGALARAGHDVGMLARGAHLAALRERVDGKFLDPPKCETLPAELRERKKSRPDG